MGAREEKKEREREKDKEKPLYDKDYKGKENRKSNTPQPHSHLHTDATKELGNALELGAMASSEPIVGGCKGEIDRPVCLSAEGEASS